MPRPIKRVELVRRLRLCGWTGPFQKGKPPFLIKGSVRLVIPNPPFAWVAARPLGGQVERFVVARRSTTHHRRWR
jgi:hypothetical protein